MLATLVGLSHAAGPGRRHRHPGSAVCLVGGCGRGRPAAIPSRPPSGSGPARRGGWPPSGRCSPRPLGLGYRDQWTRQHRFPAAEFVADDQGVTATVAAIAGASLADYQRAATYLADTWGCVTVRAEQQGPGRIRLRGLHRDPLLLPARIDLSGMAPESLDLLVAGLGRGQHARSRSGWPRSPASWSPGWPGSARPCWSAHLLGQLAPSPAVQFVLIDGKGGPDYDRLFPRAWLSAKDDLGEVRDVLRRVHRLMVDRQASIARSWASPTPGTSARRRPGRWSWW